MTGMNRHTGQRIDGNTHLRQSIADILTTPVGTRVMRRGYGSMIPELIDQPMNESTTLRLYAATVFAIISNEPRLEISQVQLIINDQGQPTITLDGDRTDTRALVRLETLPLRGGQS